MEGKPIVTITGISGYVGAQTCLYFLKYGQFKVRGTVRSLNNPKKIEPLKKSFGKYFDQLELVEADLCDEKSMIQAMEGSQYIVHTASPFPIEKPDDEFVLIKPAVEGTLSVMKAARLNKVKRVVITSSVAAIYKPGKIGQTQFSEKDWTDVQVASAYEKSKTLAESAAWDFVENLPQDEKFELAVINPGFILGPNLNEAQFSSGDIIKSIMLNKIPGIPYIQFGIVDVRDVANAHLQAILKEKAAGKRFILVEKSHWFYEISDVLAEKYKGQYNVCTKQISQPLIWLASFFSSQASLLYRLWGVKMEMDNSQSKDILGIDYLPFEQTVQEMGEALIQTGYIPDQRKK